MSMDSEEFVSISNRLEQHHALFYQFWSMGKPVFTDKIDTAAVTFDKSGENVSFLFNKEFYDKLTPYEKEFIISHECLHVSLNHGRRTKEIRNNAAAVNVTLDVVVNHLLIDKFNFDRSKISMEKELCWLDTVFPKRNDVLAGQSFEYYYNRLERIEFEGGKGNKKGEGAKGDGMSGGSGNEDGSSESEMPDAGGIGKNSIDDHSLMNQEDTEEIIKKLDELLTAEEKATLKGVIEKHTESFDGDGEGGQLAGKTAGNKWHFVNIDKVKVKRKWETVIRRWAMKYLTDFTDQEQWARINRRFSFLSSDMFLPSEMEDEAKDEPNRIEVWFFQDTSGSCSSFRDRFFAAAMSLPTDRFDIKMHCFDTQVYETTLESRKLYGFGGTSFSAIEQYIVKYCEKNHKPYPEAVFVVTDGYGDHVNPLKPKNWYWFLNPFYTSYIHKDCNKYNLSDYE